MIRKSLTILSLIGLLLSVTVWVRSFRTMILRSFPPMQVLVSRGVIYCTEYGPPNPREYDPPNPISLELRNPTIWSRSVHMFIPAGLFAILPAAELALGARRLHRRRKRKKLGLCVKCGYDLRASKDRCPECGEEFQITCSAFL